VKHLIMRSITALLLTASVLPACGDDAPVIAVPSDATFCSVFDGQYRDALAAAVPVTDSGFGESTALLVAWAEVLVDLAPGAIAAEAADNLEYHRAHAAVESASAFITGSNAMHQWANQNC
jgi:hypothetical protein